MQNNMRLIKNSSGFSLLEVSVALAILAIGAAVTFLSIDRMLPDLRVKEAARNLKSDMNRARLRAIRENRVVTMVFDVDEEEYALFLDDGSGGGTPGDGDQNGTEPTLKTSPLPRGVNMYDSTFGSNSFLRYNGLGRAIEGGHVYFKNSKGTYRGVTVQLIGKANIQTSSDGSAWGPIN